MKANTEETTRPLAERITQGPVTYDGCTLFIKQSLNGMLIFKAYVGTPGNAELIAEAFNVTHETGKTPCQLADERAELITALNGVLAGTAWSHIEPDKLETACELLTRLQP